jgi:hypothetical protein
MAAALAAGYGDCWLKNGTGTQQTGEGNTVVSALLTSSVP